MPVILPPDAWTEWLNEEPVEEAALKGLARALPGRADDNVAGGQAGRQREEQSRRSSSRSAARAADQR